jgi:hypothetical protein
MTYRTPPWESIKPVRWPPKPDLRVFFLLTPGERMARGGRRHLLQRTRAHREALKTTGIGLYYGDKSQFSDLFPKEVTAGSQTKGMNAAERAQWVEAHKIPGTNPAMPKETSCIGWAMENVGAAYKTAGMEVRWAEIEKTMQSHGMRGTVLAIELQKDGWKALYFNRDTHPRHDDKDAGEQNESLRKVLGENAYYGIRVDGMIVDYEKGPSPELEKLRQAPFFYGVGDGGSHTFVGRDGLVSEVHWKAMPDEQQPPSGRPLATPQVITETRLEDCRSYELRAGAIMVPPDTWPK